MRIQTSAVTLTVTSLASIFLSGCTPAGVEDPTRLDRLEQAQITIGDDVFSTWLAKTDNDRQLGFMEIEPDRLVTGPDGKHPAMLFVFGSDKGVTSGFWMRRVRMPLDIAFVNSDRTIVTIKTMAPYDDRSTYSDASYRFVLEVRGGLFKDLGIKKGDTLEFPDTVLNNVR